MSAERFDRLRVSFVIDDCKGPGLTEAQWIRLVSRMLRTARGKSKRIDSQAVVNRNWIGCDADTGKVTIEPVDAPANRDTTQRGV